MIYPSGDVEVEMIAAAREADPPKAKRCERSFDIFMNERVFGLFVSANPESGKRSEFFVTRTGKDHSDGVSLYRP